MKSVIVAFSVVGALFSTGAWAVTVVPQKNQTSETIQQDTSACRSQADAQHPNPSTIPTGGRARGAVAGAVAGATAAEVRGRQHDNAYNSIHSDIKQEYRQNQAVSTAAAGAVVGATKQRQERRQQLAATDQAVAANNSVYTACLQQRGYSVSP